MVVMPWRYPPELEDPEARFLVRLDKRVAEGEPENEEPATVVFPMQRYEPPTQAAAAAANATPIVKFVSAEGYTLEARRSPREGLTDLRFLRKLPEGEITLLLDGGAVPMVEPFRHGRGRVRTDDLSPALDRRLILSLEIRNTRSE